MPPDPVHLTVRLLLAGQASPWINPGPGEGLGPGLGKGTDTEKEAVRAERGTVDRLVRHLLGFHVCFVAVIARAEKYVEPMRQPGVGETALNRSHSSSEMWSQPCNQRISLFLYSIDKGKSSRDERCGRAPIERSLAPSQTLKIEWASIRPNRARLEQPRASDYDEFAGVGGEMYPRRLEQSAHYLALFIMDLSPITTIV